MHEFWEAVWALRWVLLFIASVWGFALWLEKVALPDKYEKVYTIETICSVGCPSHEKGAWYSKKTLPVGTTLNEAVLELSDCHDEYSYKPWRLKETILEPAAMTDEIVCQFDAVS